MKKWDEHARQDRLQAQRDRRYSEDVGRAKLERPVTTTERVKAAGHKHGEAFCLMQYVCMGKIDPAQTFRSNDGRLLRTPGCGHREIFWNSRDGVTPFAMGCPSCGGDLNHIDWRGDVYAPDHQPHHGQGIWRDGTPDEAEAFMRRRIESCKGTAYECSEERAKQLIEAARNPPEGEHSEFQKGWPMFDRWDVTKRPPRADER